jgi:hypothetical protein
MFCHHRLRGAALAVTLVLKPAPALHLSVDIGALAAMPTRQMETMVRETTAIWEPYGVALDWVRPGEQVLGLPAGHEVLTISRDGPANLLASGTPAARRLGAVLFLEGRDVAENTVALAVEATRRTVDDARWVNGRVADWPPSLREELLGRALGRVLAHEIGHYLLVWRAHTPDGLMRAAFQGEALIQPGRRAFKLSDLLMPRLRTRLAQLSTPGSTVAGIH